MVKSRVNKEIERVYSEIQELVEDAKDPRERINFKRKQLQFLKADVHKPKLPFGRCMLSERRRKERRAKPVQRKIDIGCNRIKNNKK